jgi:hypothetical protein
VPPAPSPARAQGPLRLAAAILLVGVLGVWLVKPIGNPCPDLGRLPQGSTASSSPSFSPPLTRTCTYDAAGGIQARASYVPWLDWIVIALIAGLAGLAANLAAPGGRRSRPPREEPVARAPRPAASASRPAPAPRPQRERAARDAPRAPAGERDAPAGERDAPTGERDAAERERDAPTGRDAAERERARRERAERNRSRRER